MKQRRISRFLAFVLLVAMTLTLMPASLAFAEEPAPEEETGEGVITLAEDPEEYPEDAESEDDEGTIRALEDPDDDPSEVKGDGDSVWTQVDFADIVSTDTIAITITANNKTYVLPNAAVTSGAPVAEVVTPEDTTLTLGSAANYGWTIAPKGDGTCTITGPNGGVYLINNNKGVRITGTSASWTYDESVNRFKATDTDGNQRYLSVAVQLDTPDWRSYKTDSSYSVGTTRLWKLSNGEQPVVKPAKPVPDVTAGAVYAGTVVTFSTTTADATVVLSDDDGATWTAPNPYTVNEAVTIQAKAVKDDVESDIATYTYTIKAVVEPVYTTRLVTDLDDLTDGAQVVIVNKANQIALSQEYNGYYNKGVAVTATDGVLAGYGETEIWTVGVNADGSYTFSTADGKKLAMQESYTSMPLDSANPNWSITAVEGHEDGFYIDNVARTGYRIEWQSSNSRWSAYNSNTTGDLFIQQFYLLEEVPVVKTGFATDIADLTDGARVVILNKANQIALSQEYNGYYNKGVAVTVTDGVLAGYGETEIWTVGVNADGSYTFSTADGKKLAMQESYTSMPLDSANPNWSITAVEGHEDGFYIDNVARTGYRIEWQSSNSRWSAYNSNTTGDLFIQQFYLLGEETPVQAPAAPVPNVAAGAVTAGTVVTFTSATEGATVLLSDDNGETWTALNPYTVNEAVTILAKAVKDEVESEVKTYAYTIRTPDPDYVTIAEALAGANGATFTVKGVVTFIDGKSIYVQDATGGICLFLAAADNSIQLGDTLIGTGNRAVYNGLPQLSGATFVKSEGLTLTAKETTIGALTTADVCTYVSLKKLTVTEVYDNNGSYSTPNITLQDEEGATIQIYRAKVGKTDGAWDVKVDDVVDVTCALSIYNTTLQLRNTLAAEITPHVELEDGLITDLSTLIDGDTIVVFNPGSGKAMSETDVGTYYRAGVNATVTDDKISGYDETCVWTLGIKTEGGKTTYTFTSATGRVLTGGTRNSLPMGDENPDWTIEPAATEGCVYIRNAARPSQYIEWYASKDEFSAYQYSASSEAAYAMQLYRVTPTEPQPSSELHNGDVVVIYNADAEGVLGIDDSGLNASLSNAPTTLEDGKAIAGNGAYAFTVGIENGVYTFQAGGKYLATNDEENLYMTDELSDTGECCTYWNLEQKGDGYLIKSKTARYKNSVVVIEFFSGAFSGWTYKADSASLFIFKFYPLAEGTSVVDGVVQAPSVVFSCEDSRYIEQDYDVKFTLNDLAPESAEDSVVATYTIGETTEPVQEMAKDGKTYSFTLPAEILDANGPIAEFSVTVTVTNSYGITYTGTKTVTVLDEPFIGALTPSPNYQTMEDKRPVISAEIGNVGENAVFSMTINDEPVGAVYADGKLSYQSAADMEDGRYTVKVGVARADGRTADKTWSFYVGKAQYQLFFGQLHSHTAEYSDGAGTLADALNYIAGLPESANVQFVAFTDHSNYFDSTGAANPEGALYDMSLATEASRTKWEKYRSEVADFNESQSDVVALAGFEMTWSGGPGHINTFNSPGIVSRNNTTLNNKTNDAGMKAYYALLSQVEGAETISQFNHPGKTFGTFIDFSYWDAVIDSRIFLVEVGNGEGQIGAGGYYPSYEEYIKALDKGWHVAPTNNQDNHKGRWGNANDARDVILTDDFTEQGIYNALRDMRVYATEDKNLELYYTVNGLQLGSSISEVPEKLELNVDVNDPDSYDSISKVEVVVNSGKTIYTWSDPTELGAGSLSVTLDPDYSYYFIRVTEGDGDLAVTAPVWVGETLKLGISAFESETAMPVTDEELTLKLTLFNSEAVEATVKSVTYTTDGSVVIGTDSTGYALPASGKLEIPYHYTPTEGRIMTITATVVIEQGDKEFTFSKDLTLDVQNSDSLVYLGIDASHYNEYVAGNYKDSMGNFANLASGYAVRVVYLKTSEELIAACGNEKYVGLILTAPSRRDGSSIRDPYATYSDEEIAAITAFNAAGGTVIVSGWSDYYEHYATFPAEDHMAAQQNKLLEALGSSMRLGDDAVVDDVLNGGQNPRLYFSTYNFDSFLLDRVEFDPENPNNNLYTERYSNYGGCSVFFEGEGIPATVTPVVFGHTSTYITNSDNDSNPQGVKYPYAEGDERVVVLATEQLEGKGLIIVAGAAFMSNFEVQATVEDSGAEKNYSNYKICENLLSSMNQAQISPIAEVQRQTGIGYKYTIEGVVTSNASGYDKDTAFFDCIYVQDETAGICCFPVAGNYKIGDVVRITGSTDFYQGEMELQVISIKKIGETDPVVPIEATAAQINDLSLLGSLVTLNGTVQSFEYENGLVQTIMVKDAEGNVARVFIDGYITSSEDVKDLSKGCQISATGLSSFDNTFNAPEGPFPRIRIRNRADIVCTAAVEPAPVVVVGKSLSLKGNIALNFYLDLPACVTTDPGAYVMINDEKFPVSEAEQSEVRNQTGYRFTTKVKFAQLTEERVLRVYSGADELVQLLDSEGNDLTETGLVYRAQDYIEAIRSNPASEAGLLAVVNALSDMGSLAQAQFNYNVDARVQVVGDLASVTADSIQDQQFALEAAEDSGIKYYGSSLLLKDNTTIRHYFKLDGGTIDQFSFTVRGEKVEPVKKGGFYYIDITGIVAKDLDERFVVNVSDGSDTVITLEYSALSYAYIQLNSGKESTLVDLMKALVLYSNAANEYLND